jgi:ankyrin repeat protein
MDFVADESLQQEAVVSRLQGADANTRDSAGRSLLYMATKRKLGRGVSSVLARGAHPELADGQGQAPLHWAAQNADEQIMSILLERGASVDAYDLMGRTTLHWCIQKGMASSVKMLLDMGANPLHVTKSNETYLHWALRSGFPDTIGVSLLEMGVNPTVRNDRGESPLDVAMVAGDTALALYLSSESVVVEILERQKQEQASQSAGAGAGSSPVFATGSGAFARQGGIIKGPCEQWNHQTFKLTQSLAIKLTRAFPLLCRCYKHHQEERYDH